MVFRHLILAGAGMRVRAVFYLVDRLTKKRLCIIFYKNHHLNKRGTMKDFIFICPCCNQDITEAVKKMQSQARAAHARSKITPEQRAKNNAKGAAELKKWRENNPEEARKSAERASKARTAESFARQSISIKETIRQKTLKFAELLWDAREKGIEITAEVEAELMQKAKELVKSEKKSQAQTIRAAIKKPPFFRLPLACIEIT